ERRNMRLDALGAQAKLLDQHHRTAAALSQVLPSLLATGRLLALAGGNAIILGISLQQDVERFQVVRQPAENLLFLQPVGYRYLHRAVERQLAAVDAFEHLVGAAND